MSFSLLLLLCVTWILAAVSPSTALQTYELVLHRHPSTKNCIDARIKEAQRNRMLDISADSYTTKSKVVSNYDGGAEGFIEEIRVFAHNDKALVEHVSTLCSNQDVLAMHHPRVSGEEPQSVLNLHLTEQNSNVPPFDVRLISGSGSSGNRVDLTFFADGYTEDERDKFFSDVGFLVKEIAGNQTFHTVAPLMKFWAAFTPSRESGVGVDGSPKDTPFGLYRDGTELRGLYYAYPEVARASCDSLGDQCDFPVLVGNDDLYGGLGGEFTTITPSFINGPRVLRHELGHSIINVGEEYDGGFAYFGVNAATSMDDPVPWAHWLSNPSKPARIERSVMPMQAYPWTLLNSSIPWYTTFNSSGTYSRYLVRFSLSGLPGSGDLTVFLDGEDIGWTAGEGLGIDRWHYDIYRNAPLSPGSHEITFKLNSLQLEGTAQLCSVEILEFGSVDEFNASMGYYGIFPTFSEKNQTTYRPTNEDCLMRITNEPNFCRACAEGLWLSILERVDLIDSVETYCVKNTATSEFTREILLTLIPLSQPPEPRGMYTVEWKKDGIPLPEFSNKTAAFFDDNIAPSNYEISVQFFTDQVRSDPHNLLKSQYNMTVSTSCSQ